MGSIVIAFLVVLWLAVLIPAVLSPLFLDQSRMEKRREPAWLESHPAPPLTAVRTQPRADRDRVAA